MEYKVASGLLFEAAHVHHIAIFVYSEALELNLVHVCERDSCRCNKDPGAGFNTFAAEHPCNGRCSCE